MLFSTKKCKIRSIELTIKMLAAYHACPIDDPQFQKQYKHLLTMLQLVKGNIDNV